MRSLLFLFFLFLQIHLFAQTVTVIDKTTLIPVEGVVITAGQNQVITNVRGRTDINELDTTLRWTTSHISFLPEEFSYSEIAANKFTIELTSRIFPINEIIISGNKFSERKSTVTYESLVLREQEIKRLTPTSPADLLEKTGQVYVQKSQGGGGSPVLRGFEANKILLTLDGVRMNNAIFRSGHLHNIFNQDENTLSRAEVIYGSGPVVYGSDALGGVISMFTEDPVLTDTVKFRMNYKLNAQYNTVNEGQSYNIGFNIAGRKFASLTSASVSDYKDVRMGSVFNNNYPGFGKRFWYVDRLPVNDSVADVVITNDDPLKQIPSGFTQNSLLQKFLFQPSYRMNHVLNLQINETSPQPFYARLTLPDENDQPQWAEWNYGRQNHFFLSYKFEYLSSLKLFDETKFIAAWQRYRESRETRLFNSEWRNIRSEEVLMFSLNNDYIKRINNKNEINYGLEYWNNDVNSTARQFNIILFSERDLDTRYPDGRNNMWSAAAYLAHNWNYKPTAILHTGLRLTHTRLNSEFENKSFFDFPFNEISQQHTSISGNIGTVITPDRNFKISVSASTAFRTPNVDDTGKLSETTPGFVVVPNNNLKEERTYTLETGLNYLFNNNLRTILTGWYTLYSDIITLRPSTFNGTDSLILSGESRKILQQQNADRAYLYGVSASVEADLGYSLAIYSYLTYTFGRILTDSTDYPLDHIPPLYGKTGIAWKAHKFRIDTYSVYNAEKKLKDYNLIGEDNFIYATPEGTPAWFTVNLSLSYQPVSAITIRAAAENILDYNYRTFASGISAPGRNFIGSIRFIL